MFDIFDIVISFSLKPANKVVYTNDTLSLLGETLSLNGEDLYLRHRM